MDQPLGGALCAGVAAAFALAATSFQDVFRVQAASSSCYIVLPLTVYVKLLVQTARYAPRSNVII